MSFNFQATNLLMFVCIGIVAGYLLERFELFNLVQFGFPVVVQTVISAVIGAGLLLFCLDRLGMKT